MINLLCGLIGATILTLFLGGLAFSIYENTGSIAFPIIVAMVLVMAYVSLFNEMRSKSRRD